MRHRYFAPAFLLVCCAVLFVLWLPGLKYPVVSDTLLYSWLGESIWTTGTYMIDGVPHVKFLPVYPFLSYPLVVVFGLTPGMKLASLLSGMLVLVTAYALLKKMFSREVALVSVTLLVFHHGFIAMTMLGASDLLCTLFLLLSLLCYLYAESNQRWYLLCGAFLGLSLLTRYNAIALFAFYPAYTLFARRKHFFSPFFWGGMFIGGGLFSLWFLRKAMLTGSPFSNDYTVEFSERSVGLIQNAWTNFVYYIDPFKNILPILLLSSLYEIIRRRGRPYFLTGAMASAWAIFLVWPVRNLRYAMPGYIILTGFGVAGLFSLLKRAGKFKIPLVVAIITGLLVTHGLAMCLYTYGECNAWFDRHIGLVPKNMGLTSEGFYGWHQGREYINAHAESGAIVGNEYPEPGIFRSDLRISDECPSYKILQRIPEGAEVLFQTEDSPVTYVVKLECGE
ncbi:MAG: phospholipid carrier-dependent glycosyltransferase [Candidatus Peribacteraceae bacterium]|nr:phospholipid carrier-dependent glycosyltransferase [Candidatus Peribacteraceae bacterium]